MGEPSRRLEVLAEHLLESDHVDWAAELERASHDEREMLLALRDIARVAEVSRSFEELDVSQRPTVEKAFGIAPEGFPERWGHLEIIEEVGAGASATVFRARDPHINREAALKLFHFGHPASPELKTALMKEGRNLAQVKHNNVVTIYGADEHDGRIALWMEFVRGQTLHELVASQGTLSAEEATSIGIELCRALAAVHGKKLVHADIKAQNVMREAGGRIVLMDFSTSRAVQESQDASKGRFVGTPLYMAPELFRGETGTVQSDIYSLGVLLFFLVTGDYPVRADTAKALREAQERGEQRLLADLRPDLPDDFVGAIEKALSRNSGERFQSAGALKAALTKSAERVQSSPSVLKRVTTWAGTLAGAVAAITFMGYVTSIGFNVALHIPPEFASDSGIDYFVWGVRAMVAAGIYMLLTIILIAGLFLVGKLTRWAVRALKPIDRKLSSLERGLARRRKRFFESLDPMSLATGFFGTAFLSVLLVNWVFLDLLAGILAMVGADTVAEIDLSILRPEFGNYQLAHNASFAILILVLAVAGGKVLRHLRGRLGAGSVQLLQWATIAMILVAAMVMVLPYRLLWHNESERVEFDGQRAYILGRNDSDLFLYLPDVRKQSYRVVAEEDARIRRATERVREDIFEK